MEAWSHMRAIKSIFGEGKAMDLDAEISKLQAGYYEKPIPA